MGTQSSTIDTLQIPIKKILASSPADQTKYCPPFRKFSNQVLKIQRDRLQAIVYIQQPNQQQIVVNETIFTDLQQAFDNKTRQIELHHVLFDSQYADLKTYTGQDAGKDVAIQIKNFSTLKSYAFNSILYQIHMNQEIDKLKCKYLATFTDKYVIQTGLELEGQQKPISQVYVLPAIATNLSQIIRYRRENKWVWSVNQFNALSHDLAQALIALHNARFSHNDIRPCNVFYSVQKNCYQLSCFANSMKSNNKNSMKQSKAMGMSQFRGSVHFGAPELTEAFDPNLEQADIYSLGVTLLCAFYLCEPININACVKINKQFISNYPILSVISQMIQPKQKRADIKTLSKRIPQGQKQIKMNNFLESLKYKNTPKGKVLVETKKAMSDGYQRLGLWNQWKQQNQQAFELEKNTLDSFNKASSLHNMAKIQSCRGDIQSASDNARQASKIFRQLGFTSYDQGNLNQSLSMFSKAIECSKYFDTINDMDTAKNLQGLALIHAEKGQYQISKPLISEATYIVLKVMGKQSNEYCKIRMSQAKIQSDFGQFEAADTMLHQCLSMCQKYVKVNEQQGLKLKAQVLHEIGRNSMLQSSYTHDSQQVLLSKAQRFLSDSYSINEKFSENHLQLAANLQTFGEIELRRQNYVGAKLNFKKADELRRSYAQQSKSNPISAQKQKAEALCNIAACQSGLGDYQQALKSYNQALQIYRKLFGSDHNKFSAMAIGNMSKVYYKINENEKAKDCLQVAAQILQSLLGVDDPDYQHFKNLQETL